MDAGRRGARVRCDGARPPGRRRRGDRRDTRQHGRAANQRQRSRRLDAECEPGKLDGVADVLRVPVGALRPGRGPAQRLRLCRGRRCHHDALRRRHGGRRPPAPRPRHRLERRRLANGRLERDRTRARRRHGPTQERPGARPLGQRRAGADAARHARHVERSPADHVHLPLAALRHRREQLHRPAGLPGRRLRPPRGRRRQDHPRPRDRAERAGRGQRAHASEPGRAGPAGAVRRDHPAERREVDPRFERPLRPSGSSSTRCSSRRTRSARGPSRSPCGSR